MSDDEEDDDDGLLPNTVQWAWDTPQMLSVVLSLDPLTELTHGTAVEYGMSGRPLSTFSVYFCKSPHRHVHVSMSAENSLARCTIIAAISYALALALDRCDWSSPPKEVVLSKAWKDVLTVLSEENPSLSEYLRVSTVDGVLGAPATWLRFFEELPKGELHVMQLRGAKLGRDPSAN